MYKNSPQSLASDPTTSCWVSASAGTGKTKVLIDRLLRLLLNQVPFKKILCITFTKAAAQEMVERLYKTLQNWTIIDEDILISQLEALINKPSSPDIIKRARGLLLQILDQPPNIQTIHSFCQGLLSSFPVESGITPQFSLIDEVEQTKFHQNALEQSCNDDRVTDCLNYLAQFYQMEQLLDLLIKLPNDFLKIQPNDHKAALSEYLRIQSKPDPINIDLDNVVIFLKNSHQDKDIKTANIIEKFRSGQENFNQLTEIFLTKKQEKRKNICSAQLMKKFPQVEDLLQKLASTILDYQYACNAFDILEKTTHFFNLWHVFKQHYQQLKEQQGILDYYDLIIKTVDLLNNYDLHPWVMYKIEGGIDHILVDEAQDTSPEQWAVIRALLQDFNLKQSTVMIVGDYKQSIYSFQGADAKLFLKTKHWLETNINPWNEVDLAVSFRSTPAILTVVDHLIAKQKKGINDSSSNIKHSPYRVDHGGKVVLWKEINKPSPEALEPWFIADKNFINQDKDKILSQFIADKIDIILKDQTPLSSTQNPPQPGDILILLRNRGKLIASLTQALKAKNIPVVGRDRINLKDELAVWDLLSLAAFINLPQDDYNLACLLKSPLINNGHGITEEQLYELAYNRGDLTLFDVLKNKAKTDSVWKNIFDTLFIWQGQAKVNNIYNFYANILQVCEHYFVQRLGQETKDILEVFLDATYNFAQKNGSNWTLFLQYWQENDFCLKQEKGENNQVKIMTVHGAKGLQSPIVIFADSQNVPTLRQEDFLIHEKLFILRPSSDKDCLQSKFLKKQHLQKMEEEHRRLLYVMLTRAQDQLYMACLEHTEHFESWYDLVRDTIKSLEYMETEDAFIYAPHPFPNPSIALTTIQEEVTNLPIQLKTPISLDVISKLGKLEQKNHEKLEFGIILHEILEVLPYVHHDLRDQIINRYNIDTNQKQNLLNLLNKREFQIFFTDPCLSEVPLINKGKLEGRIDRLSIHPPYLYLLDFKSGFKKTPIPEKYIYQLNQYESALMPLYPNLIIKKFILWLHDLYLEELI